MLYGTSLLFTQGNTSCDIGAGAFVSQRSNRRKRRQQAVKVFVFDRDARVGTAGLCLSITVLGSAYVTVDTCTFFFGDTVPVVLRGYCTSPRMYHHLLQHLRAALHNTRLHVLGYGYCQW